MVCGCGTGLSPVAEVSRLPPHRRLAATTGAARRGAPCWRAPRRWRCPTYRRGGPRQRLPDRGLEPGRALGCPRTSSACSRFPHRRRLTVRRACALAVSRCRSKPFRASAAAPARTIVVVDAQVVDAGHGDLRRLAAEVLDGRAGHLERRPRRRRPHGLVRARLERGLEQVAVEEHVQVLVGATFASSWSQTRVAADPAGVAVRDPGRQLLERDVGDATPSPSCVRGCSRRPCASCEPARAPGSTARVASR